jgi:hypothetical protein
MRTRAYRQIVQSHPDDDGREYEVEIRIYPPGRFRRWWARDYYDDGSVIATCITHPQMPKGALEQLAPRDN